MREFESKVHRDLPPTRQWGYEGCSPGPMIETRAGEPVTIEWVNQLPAVLAQDHDSQFPAREVLLKRKVGVGRQQHVESRFFGGAKQLAVEKRAPTLLSCGLHSVFGQGLTDRKGRALVKQDKH